MDANDYLKNPGKWQASTHPDLADRKPEVLFAAEFVERYRRLHEDLWSRIKRVHETICTLEQLEQFPFGHVYGPMPEFWRLVFDNFLDMACVLLHGLVNDMVSDAHTIRRFRDMIMGGPWLEATKRALLQQTLHERKFDEDVDAISERIREIRNHRVAHRLVDQDSGRLKKNLGDVGLDELRRLFDQTHALFGALSFGSAFVTLGADLMPGTIGGKPTRTSLDEVLDAILRDSEFVNQPEREKPWWPGLRAQLDPEHLRVMNDCRKRVGLPEA